MKFLLCSAVSKYLGHFPEGPVEFHILMDALDCPALGHPATVEAAAGTLFMMSGTAWRTLKEASITESGLNPECLIEIRWKVPSETTMPLVHTNRNKPQ